MLLKGLKDNKKSAAFILKIYELFRMKPLIPTKAISWGLHSPHSTEKQKLMEIRGENHLGLCLVLCLFNCAMYCPAISLSVVFNVMLENYSTANLAQVLE